MPTSESGCILGYPSECLSLTECTENTDVFGLLIHNESVYSVVMFFYL